MSKSEDNSSIYTPNGADFEYVYWENKTTLLSCLVIRPLFFVLVPRYTSCTKKNL